MRDYLKEFNGDVINDFLVDNDISEILKEGTSGRNAPTDDGPPTFYRTLTQYKQESEDWIIQLQNDFWFLDSNIKGSFQVTEKDKISLAYFKGRNEFDSQIIDNQLE